MDGQKIELRHTYIAEHGISWIAKSKNEIIITDLSKLKEYAEIEEVKKRGFYRVAGYDEERGVVTKFNQFDEPVKEYGDAPVWVDPDLTFAPLGRGFWNKRKGGWLFYSELNRPPELDWRFPIGFSSF